MAEELSDNYRGFVVPSSTYCIDRVDSNISSIDFFEKYISLRKPVIITSHLNDIEWKGSQWSYEYLKSKAGECMVTVEQKGPKGNYGTNIARETFKFKEFLDKLQSGTDSLYLTTQYKDENALEDDVEILLETLLPPPVSSLLGDFPKRPQILGKLIPQQYNMWMGNSPNGSSSGLHHDYHDNLYILIRGQKHFKIFSPSDAPYLYTNGKISKIHENGLINYQGFSTLANGMPEVDAFCDDIDKFEQELEELEKSGATQSEIDAARKKATIALIGDIEEDCNNDESDEDGNVEDILKRLKETQPPDDESDSEIENKKIPDEPNHFCLVDQSQIESFPLYNQSTPLTFDLKQGEMLYLPASWFHEVTSMNNSSKEGHLAFNYWMHPPTTAQYNAPYDNDYWQENWKMIEKKLNKKRKAENKQERPKKKQNAM